MKRNHIAQQEDPFVVSMSACLRNMKRLVEVLETQSAYIKKHELERVKEIEQSKIDALHIYEMSLHHFLTIPNAKRSVNMMLKKQFLQTFERLKGAMRVNKLLLVAAKNIQNYLLDLHKKQLIEQSTVKSYARTGYGSKQNSVTTFFSNL